MSDLALFLTFMPAWPEMFMALAGLALLMVGVSRGNGSTRMVCWAAMLTFAITGFFILGLEWEREVTLNGMFLLDRFTAFMKLLILIGLIASLALAIRYLEQERMARFEYPVLVLFAGLGMLLMVSANNMLSVYVGLELQSLSLYVLASMRRDHVKSSEAGLKYFILGALASGMLLFGVSLIYGFTGSIDFDVIAKTVAGMEQPSMGLIVGLVFLLVGLAFKISAVPFHMWTPDVYEGAPTSVTALFAIVPKVAAMAVIMRILFGPFGAAADEWQQIVWFLAAASMIWSAFAAIAQKNIKRLMAYSSIGNMGYALIGVTAGTPDAVGAVIIYMTIYMTMTAGVFGIIMIMRRNDREVCGIEDLAGLSKTSPLMAYAMAILMFSMSGIPPMAGFFGKLFIFESAVTEGLYALAVLGVLSSVVAAYYYLKIIKIMFFDEAAEAFDRQVAFAKRAVILLSIVFVLGFVFMPNTLIETSRHTARALFQG